jgi:hypothetical protein
MALLHLWFKGTCEAFPKKKFRAHRPLASLPCVYTDVCVMFIRHRIFAYFQPVSNKSIIATLSVLSLVFGEFILVVSEYALLFSRITPLICYLKYMLQKRES